MYLYKTKDARIWRKGIFPEKLKFTDDNLLEAYLALGAILVLYDYDKSKGKVQFINQYFNRYFPKANYNFGDSLLFSMRHPIQVESVSKWLNKHLQEEGERSQVIYFLTGLALINGTLSSRELSFLKQLNDELYLNEQNLFRIIAIYRSYYSQKQERQSETPSDEKTNTSQIRYFAEILGVSPEADEKTLKKAYRSLAKQHHPDAFTNASEAQKKIAEEKFIQIQEAYDYFMQRVRTDA